MANQIELIYDLNVGNQPSASGTKLFQRASDIVFDHNGETAALIGLNLAGDITEASPLSGQIRRRLIFDVEAQGNYAFPTDELLKKATRNLFGRIFSALMPAAVTASEPVVT